MKKNMALSAMILLLAMAGYSQSSCIQIIPKYKKKIPGNNTTANISPLNDSLRNKQLEKILALQSSQAMLYRGRFSHQTTRGKVYVFQYANMSCLVPAKDQMVTMPNPLNNGDAGAQLYIPNPVPRNEIIPKQ